MRACYTAHCKRKPAAGRIYCPECRAYHSQLQLKNRREQRKDPAFRKRENRATKMRMRKLRAARRRETGPTAA